MGKRFSLWDDIEVFEEEDIYKFEERDQMVDDDMLSAEEAGFMQGWDEAG